jgi:hypothetical protein
LFDQLDDGGGAGSQSLSFHTRVLDIGLDM